MELLELRVLVREGPGLIERTNERTKKGRIVTNVIKVT